MRMQRMRAAVYDGLFAEYRRLYDTFGRGENDVMKRLKAISRRAAAKENINKHVQAAFSL